MKGTFWVDEKPASLSSLVCDGEPGAGGVGAGEERRVQNSVVARVTVNRAATDEPEIVARPVPRKGETAQEDGSATEKGEHEVRGQDNLLAEEYTELMMGKIDDIPESRFRALREIKEKLKIAKAYNKHVIEKSFQVGDLVWKTILPLGT
jgi:hypothetical protein